MAIPDWASLRHAYGSAADVPAQLAVLASPDEEERHAALGELFTNIVHQGRRFEASAHAVPELLTLVADPAVPDRDFVLVLLGQLAIGSAEGWLPLGLQPGGLVDPAARATHAAVAAGVPLFARLLTDPDDGVRSMAAYLLAWFPSRRANAIPALRAAVDDPDDSTAATARVSLGLLGAVVVEAGDRPATRWATAIALARVHGARTPPAAVDELVAWAGDPGAPELPVAFLDGDAAGYAAQSLTLTGTDPAVLLPRLPALAGPQAVTHVDALLRLTFPNGVPARLGAAQRATVDALNAAPRIGEWDGNEYLNFTELIAGHGLTALVPPPGADPAPRG
ncbi:HEAT repeat domain-containing protein [Dactylosporangium sp. AC04546]|uniref:HEAT repeat domain-containing protein n=1 Tax=Dactylosporangium sp. AC04546 TaxID=2862460 RepID=UPI001EDCB17E|nr:HEAT repeat domain-containing protein [Dactylosporangium sp. AC04546]WVK86262.1 HEAT repeat domain-containing protein [Dactylosporangium sp. AC04546]